MRVIIHIDYKNSTLYIYMGFMLNSFDFKLIDITILEIKIMTFKYNAQNTKIYK